MTKHFLERLRYVIKMVTNDIFLAPFFPGVGLQPISRIMLMLKFLVKAYFVSFRPVPPSSVKVPALYFVGTLP